MSLLTQNLKKKVQEKLSFLNNKTVVYLDLEYINETLGTDVRPGPGHWKEVVQIGALAFNHKEGKELWSVNLTVYPSIHFNDLSEKQWDFFTKLTHMTKGEVSEGEDFEDSLAYIMDLFGDLPVVIMLGDQEVLEQNIKARGWAVHEFDFIRLKPILTDIDFKFFKPLLSSDLHKTVGLEASDLNKEGEYGQAHDALFDARSMSRFVDFVLK